MATNRRRSFSGSLASEDLQQHVLWTYFVMRVGIAVIGIALPLIVLIGGLIEGIPPQPHVSDYYYAVGPGGASMRDWFVGLLFAISIVLGLYRGFSLTEDLLLNAAALLGIGIVIVPLHSGVTLFGLPVHIIFAVSFFLCIALITWFCADDTLSLVESPRRRRMLRITYKVLAILMPAAMFAAWGVNTLLGTSTAVFWVEATGVFAFGAYWIAKGIELNGTAADLRAASGMLRLNQGEVEVAHAQPRLPLKALPTS